MDQETRPESAKRRPADQLGKTDQAVDEFFNRLQADMRRPDLSQEAITAAFQAIQKLALDADTEEAVNTVAAAAEKAGTRVCPACHSSNPETSKFCAACGAPVLAAPDERAGNSRSLAGEHHYHHHYHHHYFSATNGTPEAATPEFRPAANAPVARDAVRGRTSAGGPTPSSRGESAVRKMTQEWAQACNTKQLEDLIELYTTDAVILRSNFPPIRGAAAIREFFVTALDAGLGDAELEPLRVELFGDVAYEAGRCKTLVPVAMGKRREERGKYLIMFVRQPVGNWRIVADCWSSDLSLAGGAEASAPSALNPGSGVPRVPRKGF